MDNHQRNSLLSWPSYYSHSQSKNTEELTQSLLLTTTLELETTRLRAQEELRFRDEQLNHLKNLLHKTMAERDEAHNKCQSLLLEKLLLQQQFQNQNQFQTAPPHSGVSSIEDDQLPSKRSSGCLESNNNNSFSSSDCEESIVSSPVIETPVEIKQPSPPQSEQESLIPAMTERALPEKGKFLEAVMKAGPLLQNLLLAGPLPQWRHPPPPLDNYQIPPPPVLIPSPPPLPQKRGFCEGSDSSTETTKYQRVV